MAIRCKPEPCLDDAVGKHKKRKRREIELEKSGVTFGPHRLFFDFETSGQLLGGGDHPSPFSMDGPEL